VLRNIVRLMGLSESRLDSLIGDLIKPGQNPEVGLLASQGEIKIRLAVTADTVQDARALTDPVAEEIRFRLGPKIYGEDNDTLEGIIELLLSRHDLTLAILETYSGGLAAQKLHGLPSQTLVESRVIPDKKRLDEWLSRDNMALDSEAAQPFAQKIQEECGSDIGLAILGFPEKRDAEYSLKYSTAIAGAGINTEISRNMSGDLPMLMQRGIITCLDALRLQLLKKTNG